MSRKILSGAFRLVRGAALFGGAVVTLALVFGVTSVALGANGGNFILGKSNVATAITKLTGNSNGSTLQVANNNTGTDDTALDLRVQSGEPPMKVNSTNKVVNLNTDRLDGLDSTEIGRDGWAIIDEDGTIRNSRDAVAGNTRIGIGAYRVAFTRPVNNCAYTATTTDGFGALTGTQPGQLASEVEVYTYNTSGTSVDRPFHIILAC